MGRGFQSGGMGRWVRFCRWTGAEVVGQVREHVGVGKGKNSTDPRRATQVKFPYMVVLILSHLNGGK